MTVNLRALGTLVIAVFIFQSCSGSGSLSGSDGAQIYAQSFEFITKAVKGAINGSGLEIDHVSKSTNPKQLILGLVQGEDSPYSGTPQKAGSITILKMSESGTKVKIENPIYDYTVPQNQRQNFKVILIPRIEKLIELNS